MMDNSNKQTTEPKEAPMGKQQKESSSGLSRRQFSRLGAPVLLTLASRPVFGGNCLSNMLSGNLSDPGRGECGPGWSPGGWRNPVGQVGGMDTLDAWLAAGYFYGNFDPSNDPSSCLKKNGQPKNQADKKLECYSGGSVYGDTPLPGSDSRTLIEILRTNNIKKFYVTALLNASLSENVEGFNYILTVDQLVGLINGTIPVPGGMSLQAFLDSTWI